MEANCLNCERTLEPDYSHCPKCGQKTQLHRLSLHDIVHEAIHYFTHADKGLFQLVRDLVQKNGIVAREYVTGRRKKYFPPLSFFFLVAAVYVFIFSLQSPVLRDLSDEVVRQMTAPELRRIKSANFFNRYSNFIAMFALPFTASIYFLFYIKARYNYIEHLVACMYMVGFFLLCHALVIVPIAKLTDAPSNTAVYALFVFQTIYSALFYYKFIGTKGNGAKVKSALVSLAATLLWGTLSGTLVWLYIRSGFWGMLA